MFCSWNHLALDGHFGIRGNRQLRMFTENHFIRLAAHAAGVVVFGLPRRDFHLAKKPKQRIGTEADRDWKGLALVEIFLPMNVAVVAGRNIQSESVAIMNHDPITTEIDPAFVEIAADRDIERAQVAAAVALMPMRRGQRQEIDILPFENIFHQGSRIDHARRHQSGMIQTLFPGVDELIAAVIERQMIGQTLTFEGRIVDPGENTPAGWIVFDLIEEHRRRRLRLRRHFRNGADLLIPVGAFDHAQLTERVHALQPTAQIPIVHQSPLAPEPILKRTCSSHNLEVYAFPRQVNCCIFPFPRVGTLHSLDRKRRRKIPCCTVF